MLSAFEILLCGVNGCPSAARPAFFPCRFSLRRGEPFLLGLNAAQLLFDKRLNGGNVEGVPLIGEADRGTGGTRPAGAPDPVDIIFRIMGQHEINDVIHAFDVDAASGHIRCHQNSDLSGLEGLETMNPLLLGNITGERRTVDTVVGQHLCEPPHFVAPVAENQDTFEILSMDDIEQESKFLDGGDDVNDLLHRIHRDLLRFDFYGYRVTGPLGGQSGDFPGQRRAEKQRLTAVFCRGAVNNLSHIGNKTHVEHPVGLVDDQHLDFFQIDVAVPLIVEQSPGRCDDNIHRIGGKLLSLLFIIHTTEHGNGLKVRVLGEMTGFLGDLENQLPGGG